MYIVSIVAMHRAQPSSSLMKLYFQSSIRLTHLQRFVLESNRHGSSLIGTTRGREPRWGRSQIVLSGVEVWVMKRKGEARRNHLSVMWRVRLGGAPNEVSK